MGIIIEIITAIVGVEEITDIAMWVYEIVKRGKDWLSTVSDDEIQGYVGNIAGEIMANVEQHLYNQQRIIDLLEMLVLSVVVFITFYVLRMCLNKGAWT